MRRAGVAFVDLTLSNPTEAALELPVQPVLDVLARVEAADYRPDPRGLPGARRAIAAEYARAGAAVDPDRLLLTASTSEAYGFLFKLLTDPGDSVLVPVPSYPLFEHLAAMERIAVVPYPLLPQAEWSIDLEALSSRIGRRTRAILLVHPNNPTGSYVRRDERDALEALAARRGLALIADEVFIDYSRGPDPRRAGSFAGRQAALTFALGGLSKSAGLPQLKLAWIAASGPVSSVAPAWERLELIADTFLTVATPVQLGLPALLALGRERRFAIAARVARNLAILTAVLAGRPEIELQPGAGGWSAVLRIPRLRSEEETVLALLAEAGVLIHPGYFFDFPSEAYLVLGLLQPPAVFEAAVTRMVAWLSAG